MTKAGQVSQKCASRSPSMFTPLPSESNSSTASHYLIFIVVLSTSSKEGRDFRDTIRKTWAQDCHNRAPPILVKFSIETLGLSPSEMDNLAAEDKVHGDLLLLGNLHNTYSNLTRKVLYSFLWADQNINFSYLLKTNDDTFFFFLYFYFFMVNTPRRVQRYGYNINYNTTADTIASSSLWLK